MDRKGWIEEAALRLTDARLLLRRDRNGRAVSAAYYAVHAAGKGLLLTVEEGIDELTSHDALRRLLGKHFVRTGQLPDDTASRIQKRSEGRQAADYDLRSYDAAEARRQLDDADALIDRLGALS